MSDYPFQITLKPPATVASAPWLNFQGQSPDEVKDAILEVFPGIEHDSFAELVAKAFAEYGAVVTAVVGLAAPAAPMAAQNAVASAPAQYAPAAAPAANAGPPAPQCPHGERKYMENKPGAAKEWKAWMCSAGKDDPSKCSPQWIR